MNRKIIIARLVMIVAMISAFTFMTAIAKEIKEETFATPEQAVDAIVSAMRNEDKAKILQIFGPKADELINSGDSVADQKGRKRFLAAYDARHKLEGDDKEKKLIVGEEEWPLPIPLAHNDSGWFFDTDSGWEEILNRRIGHNELHAIKVCQAYVEAQREYAAMQNHVYAKRLLSGNGKQHDGLYWPVGADEKESPLGPLIAKASAEGYDNKIGSNGLAPYHGYYYKILTQQGPHASGGARNYIVGGKMTGGFAMIAFPAKYGDSGIMTFIVNHNGIVYEKDLGANTAKIAAHMKQYDPDTTWKISEQ